MNCIGEINVAQKAWILWKKLNELQNLLWEMYCQEFRNMQKLKDDIGALSEYLFEKYNDFFDNFYLKECDYDTIDKYSVTCALMSESELVVIQNS